MTVLISEVMTRDVTVVSPGDTIQRAARVMADLNVGAVPVCDGKRLVGMITDRDITIRSTAEGRAPDSTRVSDIMTDQVRWLYQDQAVGEALQEMGDEKIRRIPVVDRNMQLVGIVSLGDLATRYGKNVEDTLEDVSFPSEPVRQEPRQDTKTRHPPGTSG